MKTFRESVMSAEEVEFSSPREITKEKICEMYPTLRECGSIETGIIIYRQNFQSLKEYLDLLNKEVLLGKPGLCNLFEKCCQEIITKFEKGNLYDAELESAFEYAKKGKLELISDEFNKLNPHELKLK